MELETGATVRLDQVRYGDSVRVMGDKAPKFSPVVAFTSAAANDTCLGVHVYFKGGDIHLSGNHMLYASLYGDEEFSFRRSSDIKVNSLVVFNGKPTQVTRVALEADIGWYSPLTEAGTLVVNGVDASCHTNKNGGSHAMVRAMYTPLYWYLRFFPNPVGELPNRAAEEWYSIGFRNSKVGFLVESLLMPLYSI